jgi:DNA-binding LacI/PurR family transcriptional regulator
VASVNQQRIADELKISRTTVSRSFSNHPAINPETRAQVLSLAARLGYRYAVPRSAARRESRKPSTIGVLIGAAPGSLGASEAFHYVLKGVTERAAAQDIQVDVSFHDPAAFDPAKGLSGGVRNVAWRGAILIYPFPPESIHALVRRISAVSVIEDYREPRLDCIDTDQNDGIGRLVAHLVGLGHRKIAFVSWPYAIPTPWVQRRFGAFIEALYGLGIEFDPERVVNVHKKHARLEPPAIAEWAARMVREKGVTAFVCAADHQAYPLVGALRDLGVKVPEACSVTGFDGIEAPRDLPHLTTMRVAYEEMGSAALTRLVDRMLHPSAARRHILIGARMMGGATSAPPPVLPAR